ncbi:phage tail protein [Rubrivirga sp. IMCC45206]|uniref:phage tail protein n=1 Tax=Rubrivirga sp. IMCC45206 TaxID=3391614 RepID=UPI0039901398
MVFPFLSHLIGAARHQLRGRGARPIPGAAPGRRQFVRRASALGALAVGSGLMLPDEAWAAIEARADRFGIVPGALYDATGHRVDRAPVDADPYLGEILLVGFNFAMRGFALCQGQILPISQNQALYSLLGSVYGGDGRITFALPDQRGRIAMGWGDGPGLTPNALGEKRGVEAEFLTVANVPSHHHAHSHAQPVDNSPGTALAPGGNVPAGDHTGDQIYAPPASADNAFVTLSEDQTPTGGNQPVPLGPPGLVLNYQIALQGVFPSRS